MTVGVRRYKEVLLWFHRDERIHTKDETKKKGEVPVEYYDAIDSASFPSHLANRVNIIFKGYPFESSREESTSS